MFTIPVTQVKGSVGFSLDSSAKKDLTEIFVTELKAFNLRKMCAA